MSAGASRWTAPADAAWPPAVVDHAPGAVWRVLGADDAAAEELAAYARNHFELDTALSAAALPLDDEPFVRAWEGYVAESAVHGVVPTLRRRLVQLRFPIVAGISTSEPYRAATRRGERTSPPEDSGVRFERPHALRLFLHETPAGRIPVIVADARADFETLVRALTRRNEPAPVPASMGACIVSGLNNWDRVDTLRADWQAGAGAEAAQRWPEAFAALVPRKELYQDRLLLLSSGDYSAVPAADVGMSAERWHALSPTIRLEHECAHYQTLRLLGSMRNTLLDEVIADWAGITAAAGAYRPEWFMRFLGVDDPSRFRPGGRLENYRGDPPVGDAAFRVLQRGVRRAALRLARVDAAARRAVPSLEADPSVRARFLCALAAIGVEGLIAPNGADRLLRQFHASVAETTRVS